MPGHNYSRHRLSHGAEPVSEQPPVSVVVITYQSAPYVIQTLESVLQQTYPKLELIVSDDASDDETAQLCEAWLETHKDRFVRTRWISSPLNTGIPANCNRGCKAAQGEWIKIIAGDDQLLPECITQNVAFVRAHPHARLVCSRALKMDEQGIELEGSEYYKGEPDALRACFFSRSAGRQRRFYARHPISLVAPSFFVKRSMLERVGGFDDRLRVFEDMSLVCRILRAGWKIHWMEQTSVRYRIRTSSVSRQKNPERQARNLEELEFIYRHYRRKHLRWWRPLDLCAMTEAFITFTYAGRWGGKGARFLLKLNPYRLYECFVCRIYRQRHDD